MAAANHSPRAYAFTEKARELFRQQDRAKALERLTDLDWAVTAEFGRQRAANYGFETFTGVGKTARLYRPF